MGKNKSRSWLWTILTVLAIALGTTFVIGFFIGNSILKNYLEKTYPITIDSLDISYQRPISIHLQGLTTHDKALFAKSVQLQLNPWDIFSGDVAELTVDGVIIVPQVDPTTPLVLPDIESLLKNIPAKVQKLSLKGVTVHIPSTDVYPEELSLIGEVEGMLTTPTETKINLVATIPATSHTKGGNLTFTVDKGSLNMNLSVHELRLPNVPNLFNLNAIATKTPGQDISFQGKITDASNALWLEAKGSYKDMSNAQVNFNIPSRVFNKQNLPLGMDLLAPITEFNFSLTGKGSIAWTPKGIKSSGDIEVSQGHFATEKASLDGLHFKIPVDQLFPVLHIKQEVTIDTITSPVSEIKNLRLDFDVNEQRIVLSNASCQAWDGSIYLSKLIIYPIPEEQLTNLTLEAVSLEVLASHLNMQHMKATGRLNGAIPLQIFGDGSMAVHNGSLNNTEPGELSYQWEEALASSDKGLNLAAMAIQNFKYDHVAITVNKERSQEPVLALDIKGKNPKLLEGRSFDIRINLSGKLLQTLESMIRTFQADINDLKQRAESRKK